VRRGWIVLGFGIAFLVLGLAGVYGSLPMFSSASCSGLDCASALSVERVDFWIGLPILIIGGVMLYVGIALAPWRKSRKLRNMKR
jgi:hypothetical protein